MKKFIKTVIVASILVSANAAFATYVPAGATKPGASGTGGTSCPMKGNWLLNANTNGATDTTASNNGGVQGNGATR